MTKIVDILAAGPSHSFEFFPPKTPAAELQLEETLRDLEPLHPTFVSVTYGAGGTTREMTHDIVTRINRETSLTAMAHLTCAAHTRDELTEIVTRYHDAGIQQHPGAARRSAEGSRPPARRSRRTRPTSSTSCASVGDFSVGVAVHPEGHPGVDRSRDRPPAPGREARARRLRRLAVLLRGRRVVRVPRRPARAGRRRRR